MGFLHRHAPTLRILRLQNCFVDRNVIELAQWAGGHLLLDGVDLKLSFAFEVSGRFRWETIDREDPNILLTSLQTLWLAGRPNLISAQRCARIIGYSDDGEDHEEHREEHREEHHEEHQGDDHEDDDEDDDEEDDEEEEDSKDREWWTERWA